MTLCLISYSVAEDYDLNYHIAVLQELCRVAEKRVFPLIDSNGTISPFRSSAGINNNSKSALKYVKSLPPQNGNAMMRIGASMRFIK